MMFSKEQHNITLVLMKSVVFEIVNQKKVN